MQLVSLTNLQRAMMARLKQLSLYSMHNYYPLNITKTCIEYHIYFTVEDRDMTGTHVEHNT